MKNLLFIPSYRCAPQITRVLAQLIPYQHYFQEILLIDNISPDDTVQKACGFIKQNELQVKVMINPLNLGLGGSHKMAFQYAEEGNFDHVFILHGDDQGSIADFVAVMEEFKNKSSDSFWMGARFHPSSRLQGYAIIRILGNIAYNTLASILTTRTIFDLGGSGLNMFPVKLLRSHPYRSYANDLTFHVYLLLNAIRLGQKLSFHPISWREDDQISNVKLWQQSLKLLGILKDYFTSRDLIKDSSQEFKSKTQEWILANE